MKWPVVVVHRQEDNSKHRAQYALVSPETSFFFFQTLSYICHWKMSCWCDIDHVRLHLPSQGRLVLRETRRDEIRCYWFSNEDIMWYNGRRTVYREKCISNKEIKEVWFLRNTLNHMHDWWLIFILIKYNNFSFNLTKRKRLEVRNPEKFE